MYDPGKDGDIIFG